MAAELRRAVAGERHLFIVVDRDHTPHVDALYYRPAPVKPPDLSDGIDAVWLATYGYERGPRVVRYRVDSGWNDLGVHNLRLAA